MHMSVRKDDKNSFPVFTYKLWYLSIDLMQKRQQREKKRCFLLHLTSICICHRSELAFTSAWLYLNLKYVGSLSWRFSFADQANKIWLTRCSLTCELIGKLKVLYLNWLTNKGTYSCYAKQMTAVKPFYKTKNAMGIFLQNGSKWT